MEHVRISPNGEYGLLTREGIRQLLVDGGAVTVPDGVKFIGLTLSGSALALGELVDNGQWCEYQREKAKIWKEVVDK